MGNKTHFTVQSAQTDSPEFRPKTKLPLDLADNADKAAEMRAHATPELQMMTKFTDLMALRSAALPTSD